MIYFFSQNKTRKGTFKAMTLYDEIYFEITAVGPKHEIKKFVSFLKSGELDDFFEFSSDYINYDDDYVSADDSQEATVIISTDDYGIEIEELNTDEFLEMICKAGKNLYLKGQVYDIGDEEYSFVSEAGDSYYVNALNVEKFNEDEDKDDSEED